MSSTSVRVHKAAFDGIAQQYDELFSSTAIGIAQRKVVWSKAQQEFRRGDHILELNCGTGEDARFLASMGASVLATDASPQMIAFARSKCRDLSRSISFKVLQIEQLDQLDSSASFDGVFSNFSGLNCVDDLHAVAESLASLCRPGLPVLLCLCSRTCLWEMAWYSVRMDFRRAFRRLSAFGSVATIGDSTVRVFYPSSAEIRRAFAPWFNLCSSQAVGLAVPPSYLNSIVTGIPRLRRLAEKFDRTFSRLPILRELGDHVLFHFVRNTI
jgi:ubiquinone/menaquinone biosynthesis C-methylase UbiE